MNACTLAAALLTAAVAATQDHPGSASAASSPAAAVERSLGSAWLREVLDLDTAAAAADYVRISRDPSASSADRQIAAARAVEVRRLGIATRLPPPDLRELPEAARERLAHALLQPSPPVFAAALAAAQAGPQALQEFLTTNGQLPQLRPFVAPNPSTGERGRGGRSQPARPDDSAARAREHLFALQVLRAELEGRNVDAAELRRRVFANWKPEPWPDNRDAELERARNQLAQWLQERSLQIEERDLLRRLQTALEAALSKDRATGPQLLDRLPLVSERLRRRN